MAREKHRQKREGATVPDKQPLPKQRYVPAPCSQCASLTKGANYTFVIDSRKFVSFDKKVYIKRIMHCRFCNNKWVNTSLDTAQIEQE